MSFLGWTFLFGAIAVIGPILAHLLAKPRFRRVPFTMLQFLRTGRHESQSRRHLRDLLVLLLRCAIIVLIAIVFARPVLKVKAKPQQHRSIYYLALDDSASMAYRDGGSSLFSRMIEKAIDRVRQAPDDAVFGIFGLASGRTAEGLGRSQALAEIKRLTVVPKTVRPAAFVKVVESQASASSSGDALSAVILSDFSPDVLREFERIRKPATVDLLSHEIVAPASPVSNVGIADVRTADLGDNKLNLDVVVTNSGETEQRRTLTAKCDDVPSVSVDVDVSPGERRVLRVQMDLGLRASEDVRPCLPVELSLEPSDGLPADDTYRIAVSLPQAAVMKVLVVSRDNEAFLFETAVKALVDQDSAGQLSLRTTLESSLRGDDLAWADVVVFASLPTDASCPTSLLKNCLARGGRLVFFATDVGNPQVTERLMREGLIPAAPDKWSQTVSWPQPQPAVGGAAAFSEQTAKSLANYRFDKIALKGYWLCRTSAEAQCAWRLSNGGGFVYIQTQNAGCSILVNTSVDDSLGLLAKSGAWVAFCRFLIGEGDRVRQFCCRVDERPTIDLPRALQSAGRTVVDVENCDGGKTRAVVDKGRMVLPVPQSTGWMRMLGEPSLHVGVNLPLGETDLRRPADDAVAVAMQRAFVIDP
ncbi:MAG: BatA domain-containing protein, partial [Solirubrobacterales bacterium]